MFTNDTFWRLTGAEMTALNGQKFLLSNPGASSKIDYLYVLCEAL